MAEPAVTNLIIVGGGTAGWMAAAAFKTAFGGRIAVTLIESEEIGTIGVGEATIPPVILFNNLIGIDEDEFIKATQATFKLGIEFVDWHVKGTSYIHAFGPIGRPLGLIAFYQYWIRAHKLGIAGGLWDYSLNAQAAFANRFAREPLKDNAFGQLTYAFHFDAGLYAQFLRRICEARGVRRIEGRIEAVRQNPQSGFVERLKLGDGREISGDLFIDCSGFRGLLIEQTLKSGYEDWSHFLPADRAVAVPCVNPPVHTPYTCATARKAGWQWRIPLQHRTGNGHVFSSAFISEAAATRTLMDDLGGKPLADPRVIRFTTGRRKTPWIKNVIAMGLASGFMEPLESTSIHMVQSAIQRLITLFPQGEVDPAAVVEYNAQTRHEYERIRDFLILHYKATKRSDSDFWRHCAAMDIPDSLRHAMELFRNTGRLAQRSDDLFTEPSWVQVLIGQGHMPEKAHPLADRLSEADLGEWMKNLGVLVEDGWRQLPLAQDYIAARQKPGSE